ncbi:MAG: energy-coupling factor ABC transporter ATP-binding protein [Chloroflexota bacterium]|nr:energy-coupling factor ABC transporter ATP-binding protein [Chloroflexota bacterium]
MPLLEHTGRQLSIEPDEIVAILGAPAGGKTQVAFELAFLRRPQSGEVLFHGANPMTRRHPFQMPHRPREVTMLVQNAEDQLFAKTVFDDVAFGPRHLILPDDEIERRVTGALEAVRLDVDTVRGRSPFALSGGERRRVALAGVLAMEPEVLILDEPTANLDPRTRNGFLDLLAPLRGKSAVIWFTSSSREAAMADRIYLLNGGNLVEVSGGEGLFGDWRALAAAGIELPSVYELAGALEKRGMSLPPAGSNTDMREAIVQCWREVAHDR